MSVDRRPAPKRRLDAAVTLPAVAAGARAPEPTISVGTGTPALENDAEPTLETGVVALTTAALELLR